MRAPFTPASLTLLAALLSPTLALAGPDEKKAASKHIEAATQAHSEERYDVALVELEAAYALDPDPELLYAIGQVHSKLGHCDEASASYVKYQQSNKDPQVKAVIDQAIAACQPAKPPAPPADPAPVVAPTNAPAGGTAPAAEGAPWYRGKAPYFVAGGGALLALVGLVVYADATSDLDAAEKAPTLDEYNALVDDARGKRTMSVVLIGGGVAVVGAGVALYLLRDRGQETRGVAISPTTEGGMITWSGSF